MVEISEENNRLTCMVKLPIAIHGVEFPAIVGVIDTGCQMTRVSICDAYKGLIDTKELKKEELYYYRNKATKAVRTVGVNDTPRRGSIWSLSDKEILLSEDIGFIHSVPNILINGEFFGETEVTFAYKENSHTLIGMSLLKNFYWNYENGVFKLYSKKFV